MNDEKAARLAAIRATNAAKTTPSAEPRSPAVPAASARTTLHQPALRGTDEFSNMPPAMALHTVVLTLLATAAGALAAAVVLPYWLPNLSSSLLGAEPKAYWYLARASGFVAYLLLWLSMLLGVAITNTWARLWPGGPIAFDLHQHTSLLGLAFALFHALVLLGDTYMNYTLAQVLLPFASSDYKPLEVGLGQLGFYMMAIIGFSFYARRIIGRALWRAIHFLSFVVFLAVLAHGLTSGTDTTTLLARSIYWGTGGSLLFFTIYRVLNTITKPATARASS